MNGLDAALARFFRVLCLAGGWLLLALSGVTVVSAVTRKYLNISVQGVDEYGGYILATVAAVGFSYALIERAHIRIEIVRAPLGRVAQAILDMVALLSLVVTSLLLVWVSSVVLGDSIALNALSNTPLRTPLVVPQSIWVGGLAMFAGLCCLLFVRCLLAMARRDWDFVRNRVGSESVEEEVSREIETFKRRNMDANREDIR